MSRRKRSHHRGPRRNREAREMRRQLRRRASRFLPGGLAGRIILMVVGILFVVQLVGWIFGGDDRWEFDEPEEVAAEQVIAATQLLDKATPQEREALTEALTGIFLRVSVQSSIPDTGRRLRPGAGENFEEEARDLLGPLKDRDVRIGYRGDWDWDGIITLSVQLLDGNWVVYEFPIRAFGMFQQGSSGIGPWIFWLLVAGAIFWFSNRLARPLRTFAAAAENLGRDINVDPLPVTGSKELRRASKAFNNMQKRVQRMIDDRSLMLAAIAHDLRTVLTRLRLRAEFIEDVEQQAKAEADIEEMQAMLDAGLAFARGETEVEERRLVDLADLTRCLTEDLAQTDGPARYHGPTSLSYRCGPNELRRAVSNLIRNAIAYGSEADVRLAQGPNGVTLTISDQGPGIPADLHEQVFQPFFRVEGSRNRETGGTGLGLAIARTIARRHGGDIQLHNGPNGGLVVELTLPAT
jgi:signal transduction histidine kinase